MTEPDIRRAHTPPAGFYRDLTEFERLRERVFARAWHLAGDAPLPAEPGHVTPFTLLPGFLPEPLLLTRDAERLRCLSNVCTHRGNLLVEEARACKAIRCRYHGRSFELDGRLRGAPGFDEALDFPRPADDLPRVALETWGPLAFVSLDPALPFDTWLGPLQERLAWLPWDRFAWAPARRRSYEVHAHWALYCENYLEGFHIPFVHPALNAELDPRQYEIELLPWGSLQIGMARDGQLAFDVPAGHVDHARPIAGFYAWLFPNLMLNFYPWGLSINVVQPLSPEHTRIQYLGYVCDPSREGQGAGGDLDRVEHEDGAIVETVQRGIRSRLYDRGRYAPRHEQGVHHFHRLLGQALDPSG